MPKSSANHGATAVWQEEGRRRTNLLRNDRLVSSSFPRSRLSTKESGKQSTRFFGSLALRIDACGYAPVHGDYLARDVSRRLYEADAVLAEFGLPAGFLGAPPPTGRGH